MTATAHAQDMKRNSNANPESLEHFLDFAEYLYVILAHENAVMMNQGSLNLENLMSYKRSLIEKFDIYVEDIHQQTFSKQERGESLSDAERGIMVAVRNIQKAIKLNVSLQKAPNLHDSDKAAIAQKLSQQRSTRSSLAQDKAKRLQ